jgi:ribosomal subunit interface protein
MDMHFTTRGMALSDDERAIAERKLNTLGRMEPRAMSLDVEVVAEHHPTVDGRKRVQASLHIPRKTFRAHAEADDVPTAIDRVRNKLERQLRDHHGKKRTAQTRGGLGYAQAEAEQEADEAAMRGGGRSSE